MTAAQSRQKYTWNQEVTIEATYNGQRLRSTSVIGVEWRTSSGFRSMIFRSISKKWTRKIMGEAPFLKLGDNSALILLLSAEGKPSLATVLPDTLQTGTVVDRLDKIANATSAAVDIPVPTRNLPFLVSIKNTNDRNTFRLAGSSFDQERRVVGLSNIKVTIKKTSNPITSNGISGLLPWSNDPSFTKAKISRTTMPTFSTSQTGWTFVLSKNLRRTK